MTEMPIESPCVKVCTIDPSTGHCEGCGRSLEQIARWGSFSNEERRKIMDDLKTQNTIKQTK